MATKTSRGVALIPLTITYGVDRSDVTIPQLDPSRGAVAWNG